MNFTVNYSAILVISAFLCLVNSQSLNKNDLIKKMSLPREEIVTAENELTPCTCGVFMSGQFKKGSSEQPKGYAALISEQETNFSCTPAGTKLCINKCLDFVSLLYSFFSST